MYNEREHMFGVGMAKKQVRASVRDVVGFNTNKGHIEKGRSSIMNESAWEGTVLHSEFQKEMLEKCGEDNFTKEVYLTDEISNNEVSLKVSGRIDGLLIEDKQTVLFEIKSTVRNINEIGMDEFPTHWGQAICYG